MPSWALAPALPGGYLARLSSGDWVTLWLDADDLRQWELGVVPYYRRVVAVYGPIPQRPLECIANGMTVGMTESQRAMLLTIVDGEMRPCNAAEKSDAKSLERRGLAYVYHGEVLPTDEGRAAADAIKEMEPA